MTTFRFLPASQRPFLGFPRFLAARILAAALCVGAAAPALAETVRVVVRNPTEDRTWIVQRTLAALGLQEYREVQARAILCTPPFNGNHQRLIDPVALCQKGFLFQPGTCLILELDPFEPMEGRYALAQLSFVENHVDPLRQANGEMDFSSMVMGDDDNDRPSPSVWLGRGRLYLRRLDPSALPPNLDNHPIDQVWDLAAE